MRKITLLLVAVLASPATAIQLADNLLDLDPDALSRIKVTTVTSVSRTAEPIQASPAAVFALSRDDIRRAGATSIPEALRLVPGVTVARIDANKWAIAIRGQNTRFFNKLLVMIDGRIVYDPLHAGVYWDVQDTVLEDVDRIEVIRGPGATLWGSNAVTGVIQIFTRSSRETQGQAYSITAGTEDRAILSFREGGTRANGATYRVWGKGLDRDDTDASDGTTGRDSWRAGRMGFRVDHEPTRSDSFTVIGNLYAGRADQELALAAFPPRTFRLDQNGMPFRGSSIQAKGTHKHADGANTSAHAYFDYTDRQEFTFQERRSSYYFELQHDRAVGSRQQLIFGASHYLTADHIKDAVQLRVSPTALDLPTTALFLQDRIRLADDLSLVVGARLEHNFYTGNNLQHTVRLSHQPSKSSTVWAAASRAVRTPARFERDLASIDSPPFTLVHINPQLLDNEHLAAYELGYRTQVNPRLTFDATGFFNRSTNLIDANILAPVGFIVPFELISRDEGTARGFELYSAWTASPRWTLTAGYSYLDLRFAAADASPREQVQLRSQHQLSRHTTLDAVLYHVDRVRANAVPGYDRLDMRWAKSIGSDQTVSVVGQNLLDARHPEIGSATAFLGRNEIERAGLVQYTKGF